MGGSQLNLILASPFQFQHKHIPLLLPEAYPKMLLGVRKKRAGNSQRPPDHVMPASAISDAIYSTTDLESTTLQSARPGTAIGVDTAQVSNKVNKIAPALQKLISSRWASGARMQNTIKAKSSWIGSIDWQLNDIN